jgi:hypothetical protein
MIRAKDYSLHLSRPDRSGLSSRASREGVVVRPSIPDATRLGNGLALAVLLSSGHDCALVTASIQSFVALFVSVSTTIRKIGEPLSQIEPSGPAAPCMFGRMWS